MDGGELNIEANIVMIIKRYCYKDTKKGDINIMEKLSELTISDVKEFTEGKKVNVQMESAMSIHMADAIVEADPDSGEDGKITILMPDTGCKIELDSEGIIDTIYGNGKWITIAFFNNMGSLDMSIIDDSGTEAGHVVNQHSTCQHIKDRLGKLSKLTIEDIELILNMEK